MKAPRNIALTLDEVRALLPAPTHRTLSVGLDAYLVREGEEPTITREQRMAEARRIWRELLARLPQQTTKPHTELEHAALAVALVRAGLVSEPNAEHNAAVLIVTAFERSGPDAPNVDSQLKTVKRNMALFRA